MAEAGPWQAWAWPDGPEAAVPLLPVLGLSGPIAYAMHAQTCQNAGAGP